jgi:hypothetical protein
MYLEFDCSSERFGGEAVFDNSGYSSGHCNTTRELRRTGVPGDNGESP